MAVRFERIAMAVALCAVIAAGTAQAAGLTYSEQAKDIKVGILLSALQSATNPLGTSLDPTKRPNPYTFFVMDRREDLKPAGWNLLNPQAPSHVTPDIVARWGTIYEVGDPVDKGMGCYWEVSIGDTSPDELAQYDVLLLTGYTDSLGVGTISFNSREREKLRKFVDNGGVLWVEYRGMGTGTSRLSTQLESGSFFIQYVTFSSGGVGMSVPALAPPQSRAHSLLNRPFLLLPNDMYGLGGYDDPAYLGTEYIQATGDAGRTFLPIVTRGVNTTVWTVEYGSGHVVICADGVGQAISEPVGLGKTSTGTYNGRCGQIFMAAHPEDLKFGFNIISLGSAHTTFHKNARRSGYSFAEIGAPLVPLWTFGPVPLTTNIPNDSAPAILDDMVFSVGLGKVEANLVTGSYQIENDGNYYLRALDLSPTRDRDLDGDPDDGLRDNSLGAPFDVLWQYQLDGIASPPTAAYAPIKGGDIVPAVFILTKSGKVLGFDASKYDQTGTVADPEPYFLLATKAPVPFAATINATGNIPAPTYAGGSLYVGGGDGAIHVHDLFDPSGNTDWRHPLPGAIDCGPPSALVTGYFFDPTSGATEQIVYVATYGNPGAAVGNGSVRSYPLRSFNEVLSPMTPGILDGKYRTRSSNAYIAADASHSWQLYYRIDVNTPLILIEDSANPAGNAQIIPPGMGNFEITDLVMRKDIFDNGYAVLADYSLDFWTNPVAPTFRQIGIDHPTAATDKAGITGSPAVGKNDTLYFGTENGCFYAAKEMGRGATNYVPLCVKWRWYIGDPPAQQMLGLTFNPATVKIVGSPVIVGDMVYFAMNDGNQGYILAFKSDPVFTVQLKQWPIKIGTPLSVQQFNVLRDPSATTPVSFQGASAGDAERASPGTPFLIDYDSGKLTFINFRTRGQLELSASADFQVVYTWDDPNNPTPPAITEQHSILAPTTPDKWNNLAWFIKLTDPTIARVLTISSSPTVMGKVLYVGCENGYLCSMDLDKMEQSSSLMEKAWNSQYIWSDKIGGGVEPISAAVAGSHGMLAVTTSEGLGILYNPVSLVADSNRLVEVDASGTLLWTCDATTGFAGTWAQTSSGGSSAVYASETVPFNRPSVVRRSPVGGIIVADTGNNRVVHIDKGGQILVLIADFEEMDTDNPLMPPGSPLEISRPTDVSMWVSMEPENWITGSGTLRPAYHYLIADSGNFRVVEIVYRYDMRVSAYRRVLAKVSQNLVEGKKYRFLTARITGYVQNSLGQTVPSLLVCAVSNQDTGQEGVDPTGGSLIKLDWAGATVVPGTVVGTVSGLPVDAPSMRLVNPTFYTRQFVGSKEYVDIAIDAKGIHTADVVIGDPAPPILSYASTDHVDMDETTLPPTSILVNGQPHPRPFAPSYAQYLPNGNLLVANKATGLIYYVDKSGAVQSAASYGELFELKVDDPVNPTKYIRVQGSCIPDYANTKLINPALLRQPLSAERLMY